MTGTGTELDPYIILTRADLEAVNDHLDAYYELGADIDLSAGEWLPIGGSFSRVLTLRPNGAVARHSSCDADWAVVGADSQLEAVDEETADGDTTYLHTHLLEGEDYSATCGASFSFPNHGTASGPITKVRVCINGMDSTLDGDEAGGIYPVVNDVLGDGVVLTHEYLDRTFDYAANPATAAAWTWEDIDALTAGVVGKTIMWTDAYEIRATKFHIEVYAEREENAFSGHFDGKGHKITGMATTLSAEGEFDAGLFAWVTGTLSNIVLCSASLTVTVTGAAGCDYALLCGCLSGGSIIGCKASGAIEIYGTGSATDIGGIAGYSSGYISGCRSEVTLVQYYPTSGNGSAWYDVGGIVGEMNGAVTTEDCQADVTCSYVYLTNPGAVADFKVTALGGIVGILDNDGSCVFNSHAEIHEHFTATAVYYHQLDVGGIVGKSQAAGVADRSSVNDCYASGEIDAYQYAGGIVGDAANMDVGRCGADVDILCQQYAGGVCGYGGGTDARQAYLFDCYALGSATPTFAASPGFNWYGGGFSGSRGTIERCYSAGLVTPLTAYAATFGGFCPSGTNTVTDSYYDSGTSGQPSGQATGKTTAEMQAQSTFTGWDFTTVWNIASGLYPFLRSVFVVITDGCKKKQSNAIWYMGI